MIKNSIKLLMKFLPIHFIIVFVLSGLLFYHIFKNIKARNAILIIWGFVFVSLYGSLKFSIFTVILSLIIYGLCKLIAIIDNKILKKFLLSIGIIFSLGILSLFKYPILKNQLPLSLQVKALGISYFTFKFIHVLIDTNRGRIKSIDFFTFMSFILFFPTFSAGPIGRYGSFERSLKNSSKIEEALKQPGESASPKGRFLTLSKEDIDIGITRIIQGLFKKFIIADKTGIIIKKISPDILDIPIPILWATIFLFSIKIYYDFSGYSDIAIGLGRLFGIKVPENFNRPYLKRNLVLFWQNWHMTLTSWLREYLFMPLGKGLMKQIGTGHTYIINSICQLVTMAAVGIWHGSTMSFLIWGLYHGLGLSLYRVYIDLLRRLSSERFFSWLSESKFIYWVSLSFNFVFVSIGWIFFTYEWTRAIEILKRAFGV